MGNLRFPKMEPLKLVSFGFLRKQRVLTALDLLGSWTSHELPEELRPVYIEARRLYQARESARQKVRRGILHLLPSQAPVAESVLPPSVFAVSRAISVEGLRVR